MHVYKGTTAPIPKLLIRFTCPLPQIPWAPPPMHMYHPHPNAGPSNRIFDSFSNPLRNTDTPMRTIMATHADCNLLFPAPTLTLPLLLALPKVEKIVNGITDSSSGTWVLHDVVLDDGADTGVKSAQVGGRRFEFVCWNGVEVKGAGREVVSEDGLGVGGVGRGVEGVGQDVDCWVGGFC
jgi:hypothetical protein